MREITKLVLVLVLICGISSAALTAARRVLEPRIEKQNDLFIRGPALNRLFAKPAAELLDNKAIFPIDNHPYPIFYLEDGGEITGLAVEAAGSGGYGGDIVVMIGMDMKRDRMLGLEIVRHSETPGVGSQVEKPSFRDQWKNLPINQSVALRTDGGQIDAISGATYSSKAVVNGTNEIANLMSRHRDDIIDSIKAKID
jgi:electron transport complex protein RnfG